MSNTQKGIFMAVALGAAALLAKAGMSGFAIGAVGALIGIGIIGYAIWENRQSN